MQILLKNSVAVFSLIFTLAVISFLGCKSNSVAGYYNTEPQCIRDNADGTLIVKSYGNGRNQIEATDIAKKNLLIFALFKGSGNTSSNCKFLALLTEVNAQEKNAEYFETFFSEKRNIEQFVTVVDNSLFRGRMQGGTGVTVGVELKLYYSELKKKLIADQIIKK